MKPRAALARGGPPCGARLLLLRGAPAIGAIRTQPSQNVEDRLGLGYGQTVTFVAVYDGDVELDPEGVHGRRGLITGRWQVLGRGRHRGSASPPCPGRRNTRTSSC